MEALICNFRQGAHTVYGNHLILEVPLIDTKEKAASLLSKKVSWSSSGGKVITGTIVAVHGGNGRVRAIFERGLPGQAIASKVKVE